MLFDELKNKALSLPQLPGVYIMKDCTGTVIYVGKAKKLKNRVSQYFQNTGSHSIKTKQMVGNIGHFETIIVSSEFEALVLECSLIKQYHPKYNILLKDDKGYPYIRLDTDKPYPRFSIVSQHMNDGAEYFGPFGSRGVTKNLLDAVYHTLKLPTCSKIFPRDIGKSRPCLNYHMNQCSGWCQISKSKAEYMNAIYQARQLLQGHYKSVVSNIRAQMEQAADDLNFELAASLRDRITAVEALGQKQYLVSGFGADTDVIGFASTGDKYCFSILHFIGGNLIDKEYQLLPAQESPEDTLSALVKQYYLNRGSAPKLILSPFLWDDRELFEQFLTQTFNKRVYIKVPQRGVNARLLERAMQNANEELELASEKDKQINSVLNLFGKMIGIAEVQRIESFDISNLANTDIVASMIVFVDGKAKRNEYKTFKLFP